MKSLKLFYMLLGIIVLIFFSCAKDENPVIVNDVDYSYLALGDSYTFGESVCSTCGFPDQLISKVQTEKNLEAEMLKIAKTGWTTSNLINEIDFIKPENTYDLVTLLIGVNNQYQNKNFSIYEEEFPFLLNRAIELAKNDTSHVIVISIPDYAFTPFGQGTSNPQKISTEIDKYNSFAKCYADSLGVRFVNITDITREGIMKPELVASDGLHPSGVAYSLFVDRIYEAVLEILEL